MNVQNDLDVSNHTKGTQRSKHDLESLDHQRAASLIDVFTPSADLIDELASTAQKDIQHIASVDVIHRVASLNPDCVWAFRRKKRRGGSTEKVRGFIAFLMLSETGLDAMMSNELDAFDPSRDHLVERNQKPAGIYVWVLHAKGLMSPGIALVMEKLKSPQYINANLYARAATNDGSRFLRAIGFVSGTSLQGLQNDQIFNYVRHLNQSNKALSVARRSNSIPHYNSYADNSVSTTSNRRTTGIKVVRNLEEFMMVTTIRASTYMAEQSCPYHEEYDGNDFSATHLIGFIEDEPVGCLRIRYFADFAKLERLAVRQEYRNSSMSFKLVRAGIDFCRKKGYQRVYGHAQERLVDFWSRFGARPVEGRPKFAFSDFDYVEMLLEIPRIPDAIGLNADPYMVLRPEGDWNQPGILERSSSRIATSPVKNLHAA